MNIIAPIITTASAPLINKEYVDDSGILANPSQIISANTAIAIIDPSAASFKLSIFILII